MTKILKIVVLDRWKIHLAKTRGENRRYLFSGYDDSGRKQLFFPKMFDLEKELIFGYREVAYVLGKPDKEYDKKFPNAKNIFFNNLRGTDAIKTPGVQRQKWWAYAIHAVVNLWASFRSQNHKGKR